MLRLRGWGGVEVQSLCERVGGGEQHTRHGSKLAETLALLLRIHVLLGSARVVNQVHELALELFIPELEQVVAEDVDVRRALHETGGDARHALDRLDRDPETEDGARAKSTGPGLLGRTTKQKLL